MLFKVQRYGFLFLILFICYNVNAEHLISKKLDWQVKKIPNSLLHDICNSCMLLDGNTKLMYNQTLPMSNWNDVDIKLINEQYEITDYNFEAPNQIVINHSMSSEQKKPMLYYSFIPFRKNSTTGKIEKLIQYDLQIIEKNTKEKNNLKSISSAKNSILADGDWYKFYITKTGVYQLDYNYVKNVLKLDPTSISLSKCGIYGYSNGHLPKLNSDFRFDDIPENSIKIIDQNNNDVFESGDVILFYAQGNTSWKLGNDNYFHHQVHLYSDSSAMFFTPNKGTGKRVEPIQSSATADENISQYNDYVFVEPELNNLLKSGNIWLGELMTSSNKTVSFNFNIPNIESATPAKIHSSYMASSIISSSKIDITANGLGIMSHTINPSSDFVAIADYLSGNIPNPPDNLIINYTYSNASSDGKGWLNFFEINMMRKLIFSGQQFNFRSLLGINNNKNIQANINVSGSFEIWNVSDIQSIRKMTTVASGNSQSFVYNNNSLQEFVIFEPSQTMSLKSGVKIQNQNIHALPFASFFIVAPTAFISAAQKLADFHRQKDGMTVNVVALEQVYNEFSSGTKDISAIRDMLRMYYVNAGSNVNLMPKNLLLMGDASYDYKNRKVNEDYIPTYESPESFDVNSTYNTDDFYCYLDDAEGGDDILNNSTTNLMDIGVGRIPCKSLAEANNVVQKIIHYKEAVSYRDWRNYIAVAADDVDNEVDALFEYQSEAYISKKIQTEYPQFNVDKIYLDAFKQESSAGGSRYPDAQKSLLDRINSGCLAVSYIGHGGSTNWAQERLFGNQEISGLKNLDNLPFFITATCDFAPFDDHTYVSAGENLILNPKGGAVSIMSTTRLVFISNNGTLVENFFKHFFEKSDNKYLTIGEISRKAKNEQAKDNNARKFVLLGDPALTLNYPQQNVVTTHINGKIISGNDTLKALDKITIKGEVRDESNNIISDFNGVCYPTIFDKSTTVFTLNNDGSSTPPFAFNSQKNTIFKGKASVKNGKFEFSFIVPKDINYAIGNGKISYYAENASQGGNIDGNGINTNFYIGGSSDNLSTDNIGPNIKVFMNNDNFALGGTTDENPTIYAKLSDDNGINTVGNGIGHDITAIIDEKTANSITLNNYYESEIDDYTKGKLKYNLYKLAEGPHTLKLKAWDVYNNPGEGYTEFIVSKNANLAIKHLLNYPNPFTTSTCFQFEHNKAGEMLDVTIQIYTISGKLVKNIYQKIVANGYRTNRELCWDGLDDYGDAIGRGVYIYKVFLKDELGNSTADFQKLVILK